MQTLLKSIDDLPLEERITRTELDLFRTALEMAEIEATQDLVADELTAMLCRRSNL